MSEGSVTVGPRVEFALDGYVRIRAYSPELGRDCYVYVQRLAGFASGELDSPWVTDDPRHADHQNGEKWDNRPENIRGEWPDDHGRRHRRQQLDA
jgi:hypothetical protein